MDWEKKWTLFCMPKLPTNKSILLMQVHVYNWVSLSPSSYLMIVLVWLYHFYSLNFAYQETRKNNQSSLLSGNAMHLKCYNIQSLFFLLSTDSKIKKQDHYTTLQLICFNLLDGFIKSSWKSILFIKCRDNQR